MLLRSLLWLYLGNNNLKSCQFHNRIMEIYGPPARMLRETENLFGVALLASFKVCKIQMGSTL